jgi:hypothetical protein
MNECAILLMNDFFPWIPISALAVVVAACAVWAAVCAAGLAAVGIVVAPAALAAAVVGLAAAILTFIIAGYQFWINWSNDQCGQRGVYLYQHWWGTSVGTIC